MGKLLYGQKKKKKSTFSLSRVKKILNYILWALNPRRLLPPVIFVAGMIGLVCVLALSFSSMDPVPLGDYINKSVTWEGPFAINEDLQNARRTQGGNVNRPRCVAYDPISGLIYVAESSGNIFTLKADENGVPGAGESKYLINLPGNIVAIRCIMGLLFVADSEHGLHTVDPREKKSAILTPLDGVKPPIKAFSDFCMSEKGIIYMLDSSLDNPSGSLTRQLLEGKCTGRIIAFDLLKNVSMVIKENLCTPTSIEITGDNEELLISETARGRVSVMRLNDTEIVSHTYFPALPGKLRSNRRVSIWLTLHAVKDDFFTKVKSFSWLRKLLGTLLPEFMLRSLAFEYHGVITEIHQNATPIESFHDPTGMVHDWVTDVAEGPDSILFLGNDNSKYLGRIGEKREDSQQQGEGQPQGQGGFGFNPNDFAQNTEL